MQKSFRSQASIFLCATLSIVSTSAAFALERVQTPAAPTVSNSSLTADQTYVVRQMWKKYNRLGELALSKNQADLAIEMFGHALDEVKLLKSSHPAFATTYDGLMKAYAMQGRFEDARLAGQEGLTLREQHLGKGGSPALVQNLMDLATLNKKLNRLQDEQVMLQRLAAIQKGSSRAVPADAPETASSLARVYLEQGKLNEAAAQYAQVVQIDQQKVPQDNVSAAQHLEEYASVRWQQGDLAESARLLAKTLAYREGTKADSPEARATLRNFARACALSNRLDDAAKSVQKLLAYDRMHLSPASPDFAFDLSTLGLLKVAKGEHTAAQITLESAMDTQEKALPPDHPDLADSCSAMAQVDLAQGKLAEAEKLFRRSLQIKEKCHYPDVLKLSDIDGLAKTLAATDKAESEAFLNKAQAIRLSSNAAVK